MNLGSGDSTERDDGLRIVWEDGDRVFHRGWRSGTDGNRSAVLTVRPIAEHPSPTVLNRLALEYGLKDELDSAWAVRPLEFVREFGRPMLVLEDPGGEPLHSLLGEPMEAGSFLRLAIRITAALGKVHQRGIVHKDVKPQNIIVNRVTDEIKLTGFGIASRLPRERQVPESPETISGTLAYMAPEQTGRMNRSIDSRSDLYALAVTFYQMLTGQLPFTASDPMEWVHCHIARRPIPPHQQVRAVPAVVSAIVMKLLAKTAEERYQTAVGLERDLRHCLAEWDAQRRIEDFPLGVHDTPNRLLIPEKLYGREREVEILLASFDRVIKKGVPELLLVSGYSGIGKSSVVNELHKALVPPRGLFASGKFDQYKRDIPYATVAQAFQGLIRPLLGKSEADLSPWRDALREALGPNGQLMVDVVPELKLIIGEQPPPPELSPQDAQRRFHLVFRRFIGVFARPQHPLALFLDDLQWLDAATLDLLEDLLTRPDLQHLMLIGAYRDNEVASSHPLMRKLEAIKNAGGKLAEITLGPLSRRHVVQLMSDALRCEPDRAAPIARLVQRKTGGNPFFAIQFISSLADEGMLIFDHDAARWSWEFGRIQAKGYTDNIVDLMVGKLTRLPTETQTVLQHLACLGSVAKINLLALVHGAAEEQVHAELWEGVRLELVERQTDSYKFVHDRVQEAAYSLIPEGTRAAVHLQIGRLLVAHTPPEKREEAIFDIVNHLNRGADLITSKNEREQLADLNLLAGRRAKVSTAYASALTYLTASAALLPDGAWENRHEFTFALEFERAECEFLTGALAVAEQRLEALASRSTITTEHAAVACLRADLYTTLDQNTRAIAVGLEYLRRVGVEWPPHPTEEEVRGEYERIWSQLGSRPIEELIDLPLMTDPASLATMEVMVRIAPSAIFVEPNLYALAICWAVNFSLEHGNGDASCDAYSRLGMLAGDRFGNYKAGARFGELGYQLIERHGLRRFQAFIYNTLGGHVLPSTQHVRSGRDLLRRGFEIANKSGDLTVATYNCINLNINLLAAGDPLTEAQREAEHGFAFAEKARFGFAADLMTGPVRLIRTLRGLTQTFGSFDDEQFTERSIERRFSENPGLAFAERWYSIYKLQARYFAGDFVSAVVAASVAQRLHPPSDLQFIAAEYCFYSALAHAAAYNSATIGDRVKHLHAVIAHYEKLQVWAENCRDNFENRAALVGAEIARIEGRDADAMRLYEKAIRSARDNGFVHNEALAYEQASAFYRARGFEDFANVYILKAREGYLRWGADGKVRQLDQLYPNLRMEESASAQTGTIGASAEHLDLATVIKVSQAISGEIILDKLLDTLMRTAMAQAGAERALLVVAGETAQRIIAEATTGDDALVVQLRDEAVTSATLPETVLHYVLRTRESVILDDAASQSPFAADRYIRQRKVRSVLCMPLLTQAKLIGVLYLENNLAPRVFAPARIVVLKLLASQAAISLENTQLYRDLAEREAKIKRLVDANIIGIFIWDADGRILDANDAFLRIVGYDHDDLVASRLRWTDLSPPEWLDRNVAQEMPELRRTGTLPPFEKEFFRKDGSRVPVLLGAASFEEGGNQGVAFVLDLTERKRAEAEAQQSERRYREVQMELAHANRVTAMGQLTASIAHEVRQPLAAVKLSGNAALLWLTKHPPEIEKAQKSIESVLKYADQANDVIGRIHSLATKASPTKNLVDINEAIREVATLTHAEAIKYGVTTQMRLSDDLPQVHGDTVQLQQVMINLTINAIEAMSGMTEEARELQISTETDATGGVLVRVRDSGPGIDQDDFERVFQSFYTTKSSGMGIGLSICRSIVDAHGGRLWAEAGEPRGAVFCFTLPVKTD